MSLFAELKRRNVFKVAVAYIALSWVVIQATDIVVPALNLPPVLNTIVVYIGFVGFFFAVFFAWAFELTPDGLKPTHEVDESVSIRTSTGQKINRIIIGLMSIAIAFLLYDRFSAPGDSATAGVPALANTVAVMPFADMSADGSQEYFGDGMAEEILNVLTTIEELDVTSRTSAFSLKGQNLSIPEIAERLDVNYIVEGSVRNDGNMLRVTAQLIDVANDSHLWSDTYDRELEGVFAIQDEISLAIADALKVELLGDQLGNVPTENLEAYDLYLQAIRILDVPDERKVREAQRLTRRALELDPEFAEAWELLASAVYGEVLFSQLDGEAAEENLRASQQAATRATLLNPDLVGAWGVVGSAHMQRFEWADAKFHFERGVKLNPSYAEGQSDVGYFYTVLGWFADSIPALERAAELDPRNAVTLSVLGRAYLSAGRIEDAMATLEQSMAVGYSAAHVNLSMVYLTTGEPDLAKSALLDSYALDAGIGEYTRSFGMEPADYISKMVDGYFDASLREAYLQLLPETEFKGLLVTGSMLLKNSEHLVRWLQESTYNSNLIITYLFAPPFRDMLNQPAMKAYFNSTGLPDFWRANKWPDFCRPVGDDDFECQDMHGDYPSR